MSPNPPPEIVIDTATLLLDFNPADAQLLYMRGGAYLDLERFQEALEDYSAALRIDPAYVDCRYCRALALTALSRHDEAIDDLTLVTEQAPDYVKAYNNRGLLWLEQNDFDAALADFEQAIRLDPAHARSRYNAGLALGSLGRIPEALERFSAAIEINPSYGLEFLMRAKAYLALGQTGPAAADLDTADRLGMRGAGALAFRAKLAMLTGDLATAARLLRQATDTDPHDLEVMYVFQELVPMMNRQLPPARRIRLPGVVDDGADGTTSDRLSPMTRPEATYRELLRPQHNVDARRAFFAAVLLASSAEELGSVIESFDGALSNGGLEALELMARQNPPLRKSLRLKLAELKRRLAERAS